MSEKKNEKVFSKGGYPINKAIEVIELRGEELEDDIESIRLWAESSYSKNELLKKYHVKCCVSISELTDIETLILG